MVILITGASSGIGYDAAKMLAARGHKVYGAARRVEMIPSEAMPVRMDITDEASVEAAVSQIIASEGRIDILVNNAGFGYMGAIENIDMSEARRQMEVNVFGLASLTRRVLPYMREQGRGRIVNVSSVAGRSCMYFGGWYNISKYAVEAFSDALRIEVKPFGIDVCIIEPGGIKTDWGRIAASNLEASSTGTAYEEPALNEAAAMKYAYDEKTRLLSDPSVVAGAIVKACLSRRPRLRYHPGIGGCAIPFFHSLLPARWWDSIVRILGKKIIK